MKILRYYSEYQKSGVYCLFNLYNEKFYIGSSKSMSRRVWEHFNSLKKGIHCNAHLQRSFNKYSKYFVGFVLEDVEEDRLIEREQYWIDTLDASNHEFGYNILPSAYSFVGYKFTDESKKKMSEAKIGENHPNFGKPLPDTTKQRISEGNKGKVRSEESKQKLREVNLGKTHSSETKSRISDSMKSKEWTVEQRKKMGEAKSKSVSQCDLEGNLVNTYPSAAEAGRFLGLNRHFITRVCRGERNSYKGFKWSYTS